MGNTAVFGVSVFFWVCVVCFFGFGVGWWVVFVAGLTVWCCMRALINPVG